MLANKDPAAILGPLAGRLRSVSVVSLPGHDSHLPEDFVPFTTRPVRGFDNIEDALRGLPREGDVLIAGSLYLAGAVLKKNEQAPD